MTGPSYLLESPNLIESLLDERQLSLEQAIAMVRNLAPVEPLLDVQIMKAVLARSGADVAAVKAPAASRALQLVASFSNGARLTAYLVRFLRHPNAEVRSKAVLLLGRANLNLSRVRNFLSSCDGRVRANAVETLWGRQEPDVRAVLWEAAKDTHGRVAVNALLGLCKAGDREAPLRLEKLAGSPDPVLRSGAAWAMGETGNRDFVPVLQMLAQDPDPKVRAMTAKSLEQLTPQTDGAT